MGAGEIFVAQPQNYFGESGACRTFIIFTETNSIPLQIKLAHFCHTEWRHFYR
jgi:hypothetical protein